jgi:GT2 family glycosyltransferase
LAQTLAALLAQSYPPAWIAVVDNGADAATAEVCRAWPREVVTYLPMAENLGPAGGAAAGLQAAAAAGYDWIYWGDDDDPPRTRDTLARLAALAAGSGADVAAVGAVGAVWDWRRGAMVRLADSALHGVVEVDVIAGGSQLLVRRAVVLSAGTPNAGLFFGFEEPEYCLRLRRAGYRLLVDGELMRVYRTRAGRMNLAQARVPHLPDRHALWREYYSTRNYIYAMRAEFGRPDLALRQSVRTVGKMGLAFGRGMRYGAAYARQQARGIVDGWRGRLGRTVLPVAKRPSV